MPETFEFLMKEKKSSLKYKNKMYIKFDQVLQRVPHLRGFHYRGSHYRNFWLMYAQVEDFRVSRGPPTVLLTQILRYAGFFKSQKSRKAGTLCILDLQLIPSQTLPRV